MTFKQMLQSRAKKSTQAKAIHKFGPYDVLLAPILTEKTHKQQATDNAYAFKVHSDANKNDVKQAIEFLYKVVPLDVRMTSVVVKGRSQKKVVRKAYKKAIVSLGKKDKIEI